MLKLNMKSILKAFALAATLGACSHHTQSSAMARALLSDISTQNQVEQVGVANLHKPFPKKIVIIVQKTNLALHKFINSSILAQSFLSL
jgi:hypothetical protein